MYKITLYDLSSNAICDGTICFFVDKLEDFESEWMEQDIYGEERKKRYLRSKAGELVTDYHPTDNDEELNIVQEDPNAICLWEKEYFIPNRKITLRNAFYYPSDIVLKDAYVHLKYVCFKGNKYLIGKYRVTGLSEDYFIKIPKTRRSRMVGNPIFLMDEKEGVLETYCYVEIWIDKDSCEEVMEELSDEVLEQLMRDIVGECG